MQSVRLRASGLPCCSTVLLCLLSVYKGKNCRCIAVWPSGMLQIPWPLRCHTCNAQMGDGEFPATAGMLQEAPAKPSPTALQGMMLLDQLGAADARGQFISWQSM